MPHYYRVTDDVTNDPLYELIDDDPVLANLLARHFGSCTTAQVDLSGAALVQHAPYHCTNPPANIDTLIFQLP